MNVSSAKFIINFNSLIVCGLVAILTKVTVSLNSMSARQRYEADMISLRGREIFSKFDGTLVSGVQLCNRGSGN